MWKDVSIVNTLDSFSAIEYIILFTVSTQAYMMYLKKWIKQGFYFLCYKLEHQRLVQAPYQWCSTFPSHSTQLSFYPMSFIGWWNPNFLILERIPFHSICVSLPLNNYFNCILTCDGSDKFFSVGLDPKS